MKLSFQGYGQTVYSRVPLANGTRTRQCVDLLYGNDELCVIFHSTANATNADVKLHYRATTKSFGTEVDPLYNIKLNFGY